MPLFRRQKAGTDQRPVADGKEYERALADADQVLGRRPPRHADLAQQPGYGKDRRPNADPHPGVRRVTAATRNL